MKLRLISALIIASFIAAPAVVGQQRQQQSNRGTSVEESYLQEAVELMIIRESARSNSRDQKFIALEYIGNAIERGNNSDDVRMALEYLALEGTQNRAYENKRLVNDYPDVRRVAAAHLGAMGTMEAKTTLIRLCTADKEPMVLMEAVKALGTMEVEDDNLDDSVTVIVWVVNRFNALNSITGTPENLLAFTAIDSMNKIAEKNGGITNPEAYQLLAKIMEGPYSPPVREAARKSMMDMRRYTAQSQQDK